MKIALIYGRFCSGGPNAFDVSTLYRSKGLTGSESFFFNTARGLAELGHEVQVFCDATSSGVFSTLAGAQVFKLEEGSKLDPAVEVALAWNEPDLLRMMPPTALRVCVQQLNDFGFCLNGFDQFVDLYAFPSETHRQFMVESNKLDAVKTTVMPNCINVEFYEGLEERRPHSVAYCSSPDRGLHWLLEYWPLVRKQVPDAQLRVYYKVQSWLDGSRDLWYDHGLKEWWEGGFRARYIEECLERLGRNGESGVTLVGPVSNVEMARELMRTEVFAYPCDTLRWSEGFSVAIMDACAAGCVPLISDIDAIGEVYNHVAHVIAGRPQSRDPQWIDGIVRALTDENFQVDVRSRTLPFVKNQSRQIRALQWVDLLAQQLDRRRVVVHPVIPAVNLTPLVATR